MATKIVRIDDLDSSEVDVKPITIGLNGSWYELDLGPKNTAKIQSLLAPYLEAGKRRGGAPSTTRPRAKGTTKGSTNPKELLDSIRHWANQNGHPVSPRGRVPQDVMSAFEKAHEKSAPALATV